MSSVTSECVLFLVLSVLCVVSTLNTSLDLELQPVSNPNCIGGEVVGLTNTSVLLEYRQAVTQTTDPPSEWMFLADISVCPDAGFNGTLEIPVNSSLSGGVQLRLLQLEHGGGVCNCWTVERMVLTVASTELVVFNINVNNPMDGNLCFRTLNDNHTRICARNASESRGFITRVVDFNGTVGGCPDDSGQLLVMKESPINNSCSNFPKM